MLAIACKCCAGIVVTWHFVGGRFVYFGQVL